MQVYLDNSATTMAHPRVVEAVVDALTNNYGNPSSMHSKGVQGEKLLKNARRSVAKAIGGTEKEIVFTSGGTEANNLAVIGVAQAYKKTGMHLITTSVEHPSVLNAFKYLESCGFEVTYIEPNSSGVVSKDDVIEAIRKDTTLISVMHVNNETGAIQPINDISKSLKKMKKKPLFHVDGIQALGKIKVSVRRLGVDLYTISGHKIQAPKGTGALFIKEGTKIHSRQIGGAQEKGIRPGTENVPGLCGLGVACDIVVESLVSHAEKLASIKDMFWSQISAELDSVKLNGEMSDLFAPHVINISFVGMRGEVLLHDLESKGIFVSTGSACSSKNKSYSHVLTAMGMTEPEMEGAIRFSFNSEQTDEEMKYAIETVISSVKSLEKIIKGR